MADSSIVIGSTVTGSGDDTDTFSFKVQANKKLVLTVKGTGQVLAGIWLGTAPVPPNGVLKVCSNGSKEARGTHLFKTAGPCVIQVATNGGMPYTLTLRPWGLTDYLTINFYKSSC